MEYVIKFASGESVVAEKKKVLSASLREAIEYIESEPGCCGVNLDNGIVIKRIGK